VLSLQEILETITMIQEEKLDIRTITLGINIRDCCHPDPAVAQTRIYDKITKQARDLVSDKLQLQGNGKLALIPLNVDQEKLTWEFKGQLGSDVYLVYVNALDGKEENLLRLIQTKDGTLTM